MEDWRDLCLLPAVLDAESSKVWPQDVAMKPPSSPCREDDTSNRLASSQMKDEDIDPSRDRNTNEAPACKRTNEAPACKRTNEALAYKRTNDYEAPACKRTNEDPACKRTNEAQVCKRPNEAPLYKRTNEAPACKKTNEAELFNSLACLDTVMESALEKVIKSGECVVKTELEDLLDSKPSQDKYLQKTEHNICWEDPSTVSSVSMEGLPVNPQCEKSLCSEKQNVTNGMKRIKENLDVPGKRGWVRECVLSGAEREVSYVIYWSPLDKKKFYGYSHLRKYFSLTGENQLTVNNFDFTRKMLGLGEPLEVTRNLIGKGPGSVVPTRFSLYCRYFKDSLEIDPNRVNMDGTLKRNRLVSCTLCPGGKVICHTGISTHMKAFHLPDELCSTCSQEIPANKIVGHRKTCRSQYIKK